ncbi:MAG: BTAD domain-containing putative transcriptional regulator [Rhodopila sp.]|nr:BTAD domain-containing putative transcriptional regulator [Rhodopila sp.]
MDDTKGRTYLPRTRKTRALMAVLAMASPKPVLRLQLAGLLWSRREKEQARASLRQSVHELQDTLGFAWSHVFVADRHHLSLRGAGLDIDALSLAQPAQVSAELLDRYEDLLLEDLNGLDPAFDRWLEGERARFTRIGRAMGESILAQCDDPIAAIEAAEQLLLIDRVHEGAWRTIMRCHAERGDVGAAIRSYDRCRGVLAEALDARPSTETEDLIERIRAKGLAGRLPEVAAPPLAPMTDTAARTMVRRERSTVRLRVAPLRTIGEERDDGLGVGLAEEISAGLSRFRWISCVPPTLWPTGVSAGYPASSSLADTGDTSWTGLEADLILDGTIQRGLGRVRIIVRLVDMRAGGEIVWAGRFDREMTDALALQDELGAAIVAQVDPELMQHEGRRTAAARSYDLTAQDLLLQALPAMYRLERDSFLNARRLLERSLRADPGSSVAHGWLAYWDLLYVGQGWSDDPTASTAEAARLAERAVMLDPGDARALTLAGHVRGFLGKHPQEAIALHERAIALNPNLAIAWCFSGLAYAYMGHHEEALRRINQALRLSPSDPHGFFFDMALIMPHLLRGDYASAVQAGRRAIEINPLFSSAYKGYLSALGLMGRSREAVEVLGRLLALEPGFSVREAMVRSPLSRPEDIARYADGLRRAGLQEVGMAVSGERGAPTIEHSVIDLAPEAPHSPVVMRDASHKTGSLRHDTNW